MGIRLNPSKKLGVSFNSVRRFVPGELAIVSYEAALFAEVFTMRVAKNNIRGMVMLVLYRTEERDVWYSQDYIFGMLDGILGYVHVTALQKL